MDTLMYNVYLVGYCCRRSDNFGERAGLTQSNDPNHAYGILPIGHRNAGTYDVGVIPHRLSSSST